MLSVLVPISSLPTQLAKPIQVGVEGSTDITSSHVSETPTRSIKPEKTPAQHQVHKGKELDKEAQQAAVIQQLKQRDRQVHAHEMAHLAAAGAYATSAAQYVYQTGPDGRQYAIGGEVGIDISPEQDPEATIMKMQTVQRAALAPADPSPQDMRVAAQAAAQMIQAQQALQKAQAEKQGQSTDAKESGQSVDKAQQHTPSHSSDGKKAHADQPVLAERVEWEARNHLLGLHGAVPSAIR